MFLNPFLLKNLHILLLVPVKPQCLAVSEPSGGCLPAVAKNANRIRNKKTQMESEMCPFVFTNVIQASSSTTACQSCLKLVTTIKPPAPDLKHHDCFYHFDKWFFVVCCLC